MPSYRMYNVNATKKRPLGEKSGNCLQFSRNSDTDSDYGPRVSYVSAHREKVNTKKDGTVLTGVCHCQWHWHFVLFDLLLSKVESSLNCSGIKSRIIV